MPVKYKSNVNQVNEDNQKSMTSATVLHIYIYIILHPQDTQATLLLAADAYATCSAAKHKCIATD